MNEQLTLYDCATAFLTFVTFFFLTTTMLAIVELLIGKDE